MYCSAFETDFGWMAVEGTTAHVCRVLLPRPHRESIVDQLGQPPLAPTALPPLLKELVARLQDYFAGVRVQFDEPVDLSSFSTFSQTVLAECRRLAYGTTCSYGELAARCGRPKAARAVGMVMARNPTPVIVPCHRVIRSGGSLGGFGGGLALKRRMLQLEQCAGG